MKNTLKLVSFIFLAVFAVAIVACRQKVVPLVGISFDEETLYIDGGTSQKLVIKFDPPNATDKSVTWSSSDDTKVSVAEDGTITAKAHTPNDKATITVKSTDGEHTATCEIIVKVVPVQRVVLPSILYADIYAGTTLQAKIEPENATYKTVTWSSADESIATVDKNGVVIFGGQMFDNVEITATAYGEVASATSKVYIIKAPEVTQLPGSTDGLTENDVPANFVRIGPCAMPLGAGASWNVTITQAYEISDHEVTQAEWEKYMVVNPSQFKDDDSGENYKKRPVENVTWFAAIAYCNKRSLDEGLTPCYSVDGVTDWENLKFDAKYEGTTSQIPYGDDPKWYNAVCDFNANGYRLPTEAEWEIAARAEMVGGVETHNDDNDDNKQLESAWSGTTVVNDLINYAWTDKNNTNKPHEVKMKLPNAYGLYDMSGNISELCWDWYVATAPTGEDTDPKGHDAPTAPINQFNGVKVNKGGSFNVQAYRHAVSYRNKGSARMPANWLGFRVVRNASE
ncbi:MAG: SUMF1/EgtB/PvdO family nonheme iron enzyme [Spirochaetaceae bacterium]|nr:SUMF1/EgtB/PvdO family nonheme iron enzyme [Spirochaetaceae bacterium]